MKNYYELEIAFNDENYESICNTLYINNITSLLEENGVITICLPENQLNSLENIRDILVSSKIINNHSIYISQFENKNWNKEWEKTIKPVFIKNKIIIYPSWKKKGLSSAEEKILIEIDPKMSFGTGHNETTQLILEMMVVYVDANDKYMLDFGCGTAILAIAAVKLGVENAVAIDIDKDSIDNAKEYAIINKVNDQISFYQSDIKYIKEKDFDIICANITSGVIIPNLKYIYNKLRTAGKLFITGLLTEELEEVDTALVKNNFVIKDTQNKAEWSGIYCIKK